MRAVANVVGRYVDELGLGRRKWRGSGWGFQQESISASCATVSIFKSADITDSEGNYKNQEEKVSWLRRDRKEVGYLIIRVNTETTRAVSDVELPGTKG